MKIGLFILIGIVLGYIVKWMVNWLSIDNFTMSRKNFFLEAVGAIMVTWSAVNLGIEEAIIFSIIALTLAGISVIDFHTFEIPLIFIIIGVVASIAGIFLKVILLSLCFLGYFCWCIDSNGNHVNNVGHYQATRNGLWRYTAWYSFRGMVRSNEDGFNTIWRIFVEFISLVGRFFI